MNARYAPNRIRSTMAPEIRAAVMTANVPWNAMNSTWGIVPCGSSVTPLSRPNCSPPIHAVPGANASEYPSSAQVTPANPNAMNDIIIVFSAFLERTSPP